MSCDAKIRPFPNDTELTCELVHVLPLNGGVGGTEHKTTLRDYAYPGSKTVFQWHEGDRRNFHGDWPGKCPSNCVLPAGHRGDHAP